MKVIQNSSQEARFVSSTGYYYFYKYFLGAVGITCVFVGFVDLISPGFIEVQGDISQQQAAFVFMMIGIVFLVPFHFAKSKFAIVKVYDDHIEFRRNTRDTQTVKWENIEKLTRIPLIGSPLYRLSFRTEIRPVYCSFSSRFSFLLWDFTGFHKFVQAKLGNTIH